VLRDYEDKFVSEVGSAGQGTERPQRRQAARKKRRLCDIGVSGTKMIWCRDGASEVFIDEVHMPKRAVER
jgi:hypothetical protein